MGGVLAIAKVAFRWVCAAVVLVALVLYIRAVLSGGLSQSQKLTVTELGAIVVAAVMVALLVAPEGLQAVSGLQIGSLRFELRQLSRDQQAQRQELDDLRFALTLLVSGSQRDALDDLEREGGQMWWGDHDVRTDLRRIAAMRLVQRKSGRHIGEFTDGKVLNIRDVLELTPDGMRYLARVRSTVERPAY